jgi:hypothetical protein
MNTQTASRILTPTVFVSHSSRDKPRLKPLLSALQNLGLRYWIDDSEIGPAQNIAWSISDGLKDCSHLLVCWSEASERSWVVRDELTGFYLKDSRPERILFLRLDDTPVLTLFAARKYLAVKNRQLEGFADDILNWVAGQSPSHVESEDFATPTGNVLHIFPKGPAVDSQFITQNLVAAYAKVSGTPAAFDGKLGEANLLRCQADPDGDRAKMTLGRQELPLLGGFVSAEEVWNATLHQANIRSLRLLGAFLFVQDDEPFSHKARNDRARLIQEMRSLWHPR